MPHPSERNVTEYFSLRQMMLIFFLLSGHLRDIVEINTGINLTNVYRTLFKAMEEGEVMKKRIQKVNYNFLFSRYFNLIT